MEFLQFLKDISPLLAIILFFKTAYEFIKGLKWKKSEYLSKEIKEFFSDPNVKTVCILLDYNSRKIELGVVDDDLLISALHPHNKKNTYTNEEAKIRDMFDIFFDKLSYFNIYIKNGLVEKKQVLSYLSYYLDIISIPGRKNIELINVFNQYIEFYGYKNVQELLILNRKNKRPINKLLKL